MRKYQNGVSLVGWVLLLIQYAIIGYTVMRLVPAYLTYAALTRSMHEVSKEYAGQSGYGLNDLRTSLGKRFTVEGITSPALDDIDIRREKGVWSLEAGYDVSVPLFAGVSVNVAFDKRVDIP